jgi:DNA repair exonuclease SbcCD ATPase subunit
LYKEESMRVNPRLPVSRTETGAPELCSPEEEELHRKREELSQLQSELAESELNLATLRSELVSFERSYLQVVGSRYAELDRLESQIAECAARRNPKDPSARQRAESARERAQESAEALGVGGPKSSTSGFTPSEELRALYRQAAREVHLDLTTDEKERERRQKAMAEVNKAYAEGDGERIREILDEWRRSPENVRGDDTAAQLVRAIREIAQVRTRLDAIALEVGELQEAELYRLKKQVEEAAALGRDLLTEIAAQLDGLIGEARARLKKVSKAGDTRDTHER